MTFSSLSYLLFLPAVYFILYFLGDRTRWCLLLVSSFFFYAALKVPSLLIVLTAVITITYLIGFRLASEYDERTRKCFFWGGVGTNVLILAFSKYLPFLSNHWESDSGFAFLSGTRWVSIGVSYYVFQAISYLTDLYLEIEKPERHFGYFALYMAFFPKLLQGPIERSGDLLPQLKQPYRFDYENMRAGLLLFAWGLFKKVVIADRLGSRVDLVYNDVHAYSGFLQLLATYLYAFQIYWDFSGYTDMALGSAQLYNIRLRQNFNSPYLATSVSDFWRRWHISFSSWILDYIFKPLQMQWRDLRTWGTVLALLVTFLVSGIWHGASWGFVIWGFLHGVYLSSAVLFQPWQKKIAKRNKYDKTLAAKILRIFITFHLVSFAWIFFRANSLGDAFYIVRSIACDLFQVPNPVMVKMFAVGLICVAFIYSFDVFRGNRTIVDLVFARGSLVRWLFYYGLVVVIFVLGLFAQSRFIYFQF